MNRGYEIDDHVSWDTEFGRARGKIVRIHRHDFQWKGNTHRATDDDPQYEIKSDKTDHVAVHRGSALRLLKS